MVVHEITHSWFGNGITSVSLIHFPFLYRWTHCCWYLCRHVNACHFWLNEGWTTYIERLLLQIIYTPAHRGFSFLIGSKKLYDDLKQYQSTPRYQRLQIDFEYGENPDDAYSSIPYDKGANFLLHIGKFPWWHCSNWLLLRRFGGR